MATALFSRPPPRASSGLIPTVWSPITKPRRAMRVETGVRLRGVGTVFAVGRNIDSEYGRAGLRLELPQSSTPVLQKALREAEKSEAAARERVESLRRQLQEREEARMQGEEEQRQRQQQRSRSVASSTMPRRGAIMRRGKLSARKRSTSSIARLGLANKVSPAAQPSPPPPTPPQPAQEPPKTISGEADEAFALDKRSSSTASETLPDSTPRLSPQPPSTADPASSTQDQPLYIYKVLKYIEPSAPTAAPAGTPSAPLMAQALAHKSWVEDTAGAAQPVRRAVGSFEDPYHPLDDPWNADASEITISRTQADNKKLFDSDEKCVLPKPLFVLSDCTGASAAKTVSAALGQFENCVKQSLPANMVIFRFLDNPAKAVGIIERAAAENALVVYTLVDVQLANTVRAACEFYGVKWVDLWGDLLDSMETHLDQQRLGVPLGSSAGPRPIGRDYFKLIGAVEYTRKMDDGAFPERWKECDLFIMGVSRSGKTPLSIYLGQRGYKVANLPLVYGLPFPKELYELDPRKVVGLTMEPKVLHEIRTNRMDEMGVGGAKTDYATLKKVRDEMLWVRELYAANPGWLVLDATYRSVEESAARILREMSDRFGDEHPLWAGELSGEMLDLTSRSLAG